MLTMSVRLLCSELKHITKNLKGYIKDDEIKRLRKVISLLPNKAIQEQQLKIDKLNKKIEELFTDLLNEQHENNNLNNKLIRLRNGLPEEGEWEKTIKKKKDKKK